MMLAHIVTVSIDRHSQWYRVNKLVRTASVWKRQIWGSKIQKAIEWPVSPFAHLKNLANVELVAAHVGCSVDKYCFFYRCFTIISKTSSVRQICVLMCCVRVGGLKFISWMSSLIYRLVCLFLFFFTLRRIRKLTDYRDDEYRFFFQQKK